MNNFRILPIILCGISIFDGKLQVFGQIEPSTCPEPRRMAGAYICLRTVYEKSNRESHDPVKVVDEAWYCCDGSEDPFGGVQCYDGRSWPKLSNPCGELTPPPRQWTTPRWPTTPWGLRAMTTVPFTHPYNKPTSPETLPACNSWTMTIRPGVPCVPTTVSQWRWRYTGTTRWIRQTTTRRFTTRPTTTTTTTTTIPTPSGCQFNTPLSQPPVQPPPGQLEWCGKFRDESRVMCLPDSPDLIRLRYAPVGAILESHNCVRRSLNNPRPARQMRDLQWDDALAAMAARWASQCISVIYRPSAHTPSSELRMPWKNWNWVGQNLAWGQNDWNKVIQQWADEQKDWRYAIGAVKPLDQFKPVGHFTQIIWEETLYVGCAEAQCENLERYNGRFYVCLYGPGGNRGVGQQAYAYPYVS